MTTTSRRRNFKSAASSNSSLPASPPSTVTDTSSLEQRLSNFSFSYALPSTQNPPSSLTPPQAPSEPQSLNAIFPIELISLVLEHGSTGFLERSRFLCAASLVCQSWNAEVRPLLWRKIFIAREKQAVALLKSADLGQFQTSNLSVFGGTMTESSTTKLLGSLVGLQDLQLRHFPEAANFRLSMLACPHLEGLKTLSMSGVYVHTLVDNPLPFPSLESLSIHEVETVSPTFYSKFIDCPLKHLRISQPSIPIPDPEEIDIAMLCKSVATTVTSFTLQFNRSMPLILPIFPKFSNLNHLELGCSGEEVREILRILPSILEVFTLIGHNRGSFMEDIHSVLGLRSLSRIKRIKFPDCGPLDLPKIPGSSELLLAFDTRGVGMDLVEGEPSHE